MIKSKVGYFVSLCCSFCPLPETSLKFCKVSEGRHFNLKVLLNTCILIFCSEETVAGAFAPPDLSAMNSLWLLDQWMLSHQYKSRGFLFSDFIIRNALSFHNNHLERSWAKNMFLQAGWGIFHDVAYCLESFHLTISMILLIVTFSSTYTQ